jgi:PKD repeat protein
LTVAGLVALTSACTMKSQDPPPFSGPSELDQSIVIAVSPDQLPQDGASQSLITVTARDGSAQPIRNLTLRTFTAVSGTPIDFGSLSARSIVTGADGRATFVYTAPPGPAVSSDDFIVVDIIVTPQGTDFNNSRARTAAIRLYPPGVIIPPDSLTPAFTFNPPGPQENQTVLFDASASTGAIVDYQWSFGDGGRSSGRTTSHQYGTAGTYVVTLTISDGFGRTQSTSQSITVGAGVNPTAAFVSSPSAPVPAQTVFFNASASRAAPGRTIVSYQWDFGDGGSATGVQTQHIYAAAGGYNVTLTVTDDAGRRGVVTQGITVGNDSPTAAFEFTPTAPTAGSPVAFNASGSSAVAGRTIVSYSWTFSGPGGATRPPQSGVAVTETFPVAGPWNVTLTVVDSQNKSASLTRTVTVSP